MVLLNFIGPPVYKLISDYPGYDRAVSKHQQLYEKPKNEIHVTYIWSTHVQEPEEILDEYHQNLRRLSEGFNYKTVYTEDLRDEDKREVFICLILSIYIRQRQLEYVTQDSTMPFDQARVLENSQKSSESYFISQKCFSAASLCEVNPRDPNENIASSATCKTEKYLFSWNNRHLRHNCPTWKAMVWKCGKIKIDWGESKIDKILR